MNDLIGRFKKIELEISQEKGEVNLFALFLREDALDQWDVLIASAWAEKDKKATLAYLASKIQKKFTPSELVQLSRIVIIDTNNPALPSINQAIQINHGSIEIQNSNFFGLEIKHAHIITSQSLIAKELLPAA